MTDSVEGVPGAIYENAGRVRSAGSRLAIENALHSYCRIKSVVARI